MTESAAEDIIMTHERCEHLDGLAPPKRYDEGSSYARGRGSERAAGASWRRWLLAVYWNSEAS